MHVIDMIFFWADMEPGRPAIILADRMLTYRGLAVSIEAIAARLTERGPPDQGKAIAVALDNEAKLLTTSLAVLRAGFSVAPAAPRLFPHLIANGIRPVITEGEAAPGMSHLPFDESWLAAGMPTPSPRNSESYGDVIFFTSGTTGTPKKIVERREASVVRAQASIFLGLSEQTRILILPGLSTLFGFNLACEILRLGKTACFSRLSEQTLGMISAFDIDSIHASSNQALTLCQLKEKFPNYSFNSVRTIRIGGSVPSKNLMDLIRRRLCKDVTVIYASTEGSQAATAPYSVIEHVEDAVGIVMPWTKLEIIDDDGNVLPPGKQGKVRYRNEYFLKNQPDSESADDQWFYSGDLGLVTEDGILCIRGRSDDVINRGGVKVSAARVEERLLACSGVKDAGVCGVDGVSEMTQLWVAVVPDRTFKPADFRHFLESDESLRQSLGTDIDQVFVVEEIPRGDLGKIKRLDLRNKLLDMLKAAVASAR